MYALEVHNLTVTYHNTPVLWGVSFEVPKGAMVGILGPNGAGKSTLLKTILGFIKPVSGTIRCFGKTIEQLKKHIAYVPQKESVDWTFPATVWDVVMMGRYGKRKLYEPLRLEDKKAVIEALKKVDMLLLKHRHISALSGGQQQRVFLARALAQDPILFLLDEPFAGIDMASEENIITLLKQLKNEGKTIIVVHHNLLTAPQYFDYLLFLNSRRIAWGPTKEVFTEENIQKTYGGRLPTLSKISTILKTTGQPPVE